MKDPVGLAYLIGFIVSWFVLYNRVGFPIPGVDYREFLLPNIPWFVLMWIKVILWPATLAFWIATGAGPSRWRAVQEIDGRPARRIIRVPAG